VFTITIFSQYFYKHTPKQIFEIDFELNLLPTTMWSDFFRHYSQRGARSEHYFLIKSALIEWKQTLHTKIYPFIGNINSRKILNFVHLRRHNSSGPDKQVSAWNNGRSAGSDLEVKKSYLDYFLKVYSIRGRRMAILGANLSEILCRDGYFVKSESRRINARRRP
jgi:hypothetical protein